MRESISLAFLATLQALTARQRAVLLLRDVIGWRATEVATALDLSVPAVNSALHRARRTVADRYGGPGRPTDGSVAPPQPSIRALVDRFVRTWEAGDVTGLVALLRDDALMAMPPRPSLESAAAIGAFLAAGILRGDARTRLSPTGANLGAAFVAYVAPGAGEPLEAFALLVLTIDDGMIGRIDAFADRDVIRRFGSPRLSG
jgi:RNA polymerase sigma-70 factor (ECF subfamily)